MNEKDKIEAAATEPASMTEPGPAPASELQAAPKNGETADPKPRKKKRAKAEPTAKLVTELVKPKKPESDAAPEEATAKSKRTKKAATQDEPATKKPRLKKAAESITLGQLAEQYIAALEEEGKSDGTLFSYKLEMRTALAALGETTRLADLTARKVGNFFASDKVTKTRTGRQKSPLSIAKTIRVLTQALDFAEEQGLVAEAPLPKQD